MRSPSSASPSAAASPAARSTAAGRTSPACTSRRSASSRGQDVHELTGDTSVDLANYIRATAAHLDDPTYFSIVVFLLANAAVSERYAELHLELFDRDRPGRGGVPDRHRSRLDPTRRRRLGGGRRRAGAHSSTPVWPSTSSIDVESALRAVSVILRTYGTPKALARLRSRASARTRRDARPKRRSAKADV